MNHIEFNSLGNERMKLLPYFEQEFKIFVSDTDLEKKIKESKLKGKYVNGTLKLQRNYWWLHNAFRPVAVCQYSGNKQDGQSILVKVRPATIGIAFMILWFVSVFSYSIAALFNGAFFALPIGLLMISLGYLVILIGFWVEVPMLKRELNKLLS